MSGAGRVRGSLLLSACADALGARFEGTPVVDPAALDRWLTAATGRLRWTDDTALTLVLAEHLVRTGGTVDQDLLAAGFAAAWWQDPDRGYSPGAATVLARIHAGAPWKQVAARLFGGRGSLGNGAAMRVAPVGLVPGLALPAVADRARRSAAVTHAHPQAQDGAAVQAVAVALASRTRPERPPRPDGFVAEVAAHARTAAFRAALQRVPPLVHADPAVEPAVEPAQVAAVLGNDATAVGSVPAALAAFLTSPDDATAAIRFAIRIGGDTDTIAAMTGALAGARLGDGCLSAGSLSAGSVPAGSLPALWQRRLEAADRLATVAAALAALPAPVPARG